MNRVIEWILCHIFNYHKWGDEWVTSNFGVFSATCIHCGHKDKNKEAVGK